MTNNIQTDAPTCETAARRLCGTQDQPILLSSRSDESGHSRLAFEDVFVGNRHIDRDGKVAELPEYSDCVVVAAGDGREHHQQVEVRPPANWIGPRSIRNDCFIKL